MDLDNDSQETPMTRVNLYPERRHQASEEETDTSKSLKHSESQAIRIKSPDKGSTAGRKRQASLDFSTGRLSTNKSRNDPISIREPLRNPTSRDDPRRKKLADVAEETLKLLPGLLATRPDVATDGFLCQKEDIDAKYCPNLPPIKVRVVNSDTIDVALKLDQLSRKTSDKPVAVLNMANATKAGGGWKHGAKAQEEALCYRTSLFFTLKHKYYPISDDAVIYSPMVMIIRESMGNGNDLLDFRDPSKLDVISVISCAAVCRPSVRQDKNGNSTYGLAADKQMMMQKMRIILRNAIRNKHRCLVLGAFGCGAFGNPNNQVAILWKTVLQEREFQGGWWADLVFAVLGGTSGADDNFKVFRDELDGLVLQ